MNGAAMRMTRPVIEATFALMLKRSKKLPSERLTISPKMARLQAQIQSEPPRVPVYSYH